MMESPIASMYILKVKFWVDLDANDQAMSRWYDETGMMLIIAACSAFIRQQKDGCKCFAEAMAWMGPG